VPVIAVPTSVGYGAAFKGLAALLGMMNSCASNVSVVNIDNGFGAGYVAALINRLEGLRRELPTLARRGRVGDPSLPRAEKTAERRSAGRVRHPSPRGQR
jgi:hypothetical protein